MAKSLKKNLGLLCVDLFAVGCNQNTDVSVQIIQLPEDFGTSAWNDSAPTGRIF